MKTQIELGSDGWPILLSGEATEEVPEVASRSLDEEVAQRAAARQASRDSAWQSSGDEDFDRLVLAERLELVADVIADTQLGVSRKSVKFKAPRGFIRDQVTALSDEDRTQLMTKLQHRGLSEQDAAIAANV